jgi:hypothetical protein
MKITTENQMAAGIAQQYINLAVQRDPGVLHLIYMACVLMTHCNGKTTLRSFAQMVESELHIDRSGLDDLFRTDPTTQANEFTSDK